MTEVIQVAVVGALLVYGWFLHSWCHQLSAQVATLTLAVRELNDRIAVAVAIDDEGPLP